MAETVNRGELLALTTEIVSAHVANNSVDRGGLTSLIQSVFDMLSALASDEPAPAELTPAVPIKKSVTDEYIICLEDGKRLKMLKRHLMTSYGMTPEEYRAKWGLKADYPMVAPNYALKRQELAKKIGLGRKPRVGRAGLGAESAREKAARKEGCGLRTRKRLITTWADSGQPRSKMQVVEHPGGQNTRAYSAFHSGRMGAPAAFLARASETA